MYELKLIRSVLKEDAPVNVTTAADAVKYIERNCQPKDEQWREMAWVLTLDSGQRITGHFLLSVGGVSETVFDKKIIAKVAVENLAHSVILVHNHPSGNPMPSQSDIKQTKEVSNGLKCLDISLLDHIIISEDKYFSFASETVTKI